MIEDRDLFDRAVQRFAPADGSFERLVTRRDRKRRNKRIAAGIVGILVAFVGIGAALRAIDADRGMPVAPGPSVPRHAENGDIAFGTYPGNGDGLRSIGVEGGSDALLVPCTDACHDIAMADWSPDGTRLAYFEFSYEAPGSSGIYVLNVQTGATTRLTRCGAGCHLQQGLDWSPDGSKIAYDEDDPWRIVVMDADGSDPTVLPTGSVTEPSQPSWSPDGTRIAFSGFRRDTSGIDSAGIYTVDVDGSNLTVLNEQPGNAGPTSPAWSPDGTEIAFLVTPSRGVGFASQVWMMSAGGSNETLIADFCCTDSWGPVWSPDGRKLAFVTQPAEDEAWSLYVMNADGNDLTRIGEAFGRPAWRPSVPTQEASS
jgi:Tol biopolymer transport system component